MISKFLCTHDDDFSIRPERALYIFDGNNAIYIFEEQEHKGSRKTFIFKYSMGYLSECRTEIDTFNNYFALVPNSLHSEYTTF